MNYQADGVEIRQHPEIRLENCKPKKLSKEKDSRSRCKETGSSKHKKDSLEMRRSNQRSSKRSS